MQNITLFSDNDEDKAHKLLDKNFKKIIGSNAQPNWRVVGSKRQFSRGARSSAIPGKLSFDNVVWQNLAVQLSIVFSRFCKKMKIYFLRLYFTPNFHHHIIPN